MNINNPSEILIFDTLTPIEINVQIGEEKYLLKEATGGAVAAYQNAILRTTKLGESGRPERIEGAADAELLLLSLCLFKVNDKGEQSNVSVMDVKNLPSKVSKKLIEHLRNISGMNTVQETKEDLEKQLKDIQDKLSRQKEEEESLKN